MVSRPSAGAALASAALASFTVWITWRAKALEAGLQSEDQPAVLLHKQAPDFSLPALDGRMVSLAAERGRRTMVLSFWASWCGPCRLELPVLRSFYERVHKPGSDFEVLAISLDEDSGAAERMAKDLRLPFPVLLDPSQKSAAAYGVSGIPALFVVAKNGRVAYGASGFRPGFEVMLATQLGIDPKLVLGRGPNGKPSD